MAEPKIIIFDLETLPNLPEILKVFPSLSAYPGRTMKAQITTILCAGWKQYGKKKTHCIKAWDYDLWDEDINNDMMVCHDLREVLKDADAIVTHNGVKFDLKFFNTRLIYHGFDPLPEIAHIDTIQIARKNLLAYSNRLGNLGEFLCEDDKVDTGGWDLWVRCHNKEKKALEHMAKYCKQDVDLLEKLFVKVLPFVKNLPNRNLYRKKAQFEEGIEVCPTCGHDELFAHGWRHTKTKSYRRFYCPQCGSTCRGNLKEKDLRQA